MSMQHSSAEYEYRAGLRERIARSNPEGFHEVHLPGPGERADRVPVRRAARAFLYPISPNVFSTKIHPVSVNAASSVVATTTLAVSSPSFPIFFAIM